MLHHLFGEAFIKLSKRLKGRVDMVLSLPAVISLTTGMIHQHPGLQPPRRGSRNTLNQISHPVPSLHQKIWTAKRKLPNLPKSNSLVVLKRTGTEENIGMATIRKAEIKKSTKTVGPGGHDQGKEEGLIQALTAPSPALQTEHRERSGGLSHDPQTERGGDPGKSSMIWNMWNAN